MHLIIIAYRRKMLILQATTSLVSTDFFTIPRISYCYCNSKCRLIVFTMPSNGNALQYRRQTVGTLKNMTTDRLGRIAMSKTYCA